MSVRFRYGRERTQPQRRVTPEEAGSLIKEAAEKLGVEEKEVDHAIWGYASNDEGLKVSPK